MTRRRELFTNLSRTNPDLHVELGTHAKCVVKGVGIVRFQLESGGSLEVRDVLYVLELRLNLASILTLEDSEYAISYERGRVFIRPMGSRIDSTRVPSVK